jgi:Flp pilus assembly protein TadG
MKPVFFWTTAMKIDLSKHSFFSWLPHKLTSFAHNESGAISYLTALLSLVMMSLVGLATDYGFAVVHKGKLDAAAQAAAISGANAARNLLQLNMTQNTNFDATALAEGEDVANRAFDGQLGATGGEMTVVAKFVTVNRVGNTLSAQVSYNGMYTPFFSAFLGVPEIKVSGRGSIIIGLVDNPPSSKLVEEVWESDNVPSYTSKTVADPNYRDWKIQGGPISIKPTWESQAGNFSMSIGDGTNNSIAKKVYMPAGAYELRYWYRSSVLYPEYQPAYICDPQLDNLAWANSGNYREYASAPWRRGHPYAAQVGVFLHPVKDDPQLALAPPANSAFTNRIDTCSYSGRWIERSINLEVTNSGYFWLAFAGEAPAGSDRRGGWIGKVKLCIASCGDPPVNNFPYAPDAVIFTDSFSTSAPNRSPFNPQSGTFPPSAQYEVDPSGIWAIEGLGPNASSATSVLSSNERPLIEGTHVMFTSSVKFTRRVLLLPGRYTFRYWKLGDGDSGFCALAEVERSGNGFAPAGCPDRRVAASWSWTSPCLTVYATSFIKLGMNVFPYGRNPNLRLDKVNVLAGYPNFRFQTSQSTPNFCSVNYSVGVPWMDQMGAKVIALDRVNVTPPLWQ